MAKTFSTGDARFEGLQSLGTDEAGQVRSLPVIVNYAVTEDGVEVTRTREVVDMWASLTAEEQAAVQALYDKITAGLRAKYE